MKQNLLLLTVSTLLIIASLASCKKECEPADVDDINSLYFQFNTDGGPGSFSADELDSVYFVRYQTAAVDSFSFPVDTFNLYGDEVSFYTADFTLRFGRNHPIGVPSGPPYYSTFMYKFLSRDEDFQVRLQGIELEGNYQDDCSYVPALKRFQLNDDTLIVTGSTAFVQLFKD